MPLSTQVRGFKPGRSRQDFSGQKKSSVRLPSEGSKADLRHAKECQMEGGGRHLGKIIGQHSRPQFHLSLLGYLVSYGRGGTWRRK